MKNNVLLSLLAALVITLPGCAVYKVGSGIVGVVVISGDDLRKEAYGQQLTLVRFRSEIRWPVMVSLDEGHMIPNPGTKLPEFPSHRATFWSVKQTAQGQPPELEQARSLVLEPNGTYTMYTFSQFMGFHTRVGYWWTDEFNKIHYESVDVLIFPRDIKATPDPQEIVLVEHPGKQPVKLHTPR